MSYPEGGQDGTQPILTDPDNGFERIFHSVRKGIKYSTVVVPAGVEFTIGYTKPSNSIDISLEVLASGRWLIAGTFDTDTFANLGFWVQTPRRGPIPPIVTPQNIRDARIDGPLDEAGINAAGLQLFTGELQLSPQAVDRFLRRIWRPGINPAYEQTEIPYRLGKPGEDRLLPQKSHLGHEQRGDSTLKVHRTPMVT